MHKLIYILIFTLLANAVAVMAASSHLEIDKVEITSDGSTVLSTSSSSGSFDVEPGQELSIKVILENTYDDKTDNDIEEVEVTARIEGIDDGDDISDESDTVTVRAEGKKTIKLKLKIPKDASSYESYDLEITAVGEDQNGTEQSDEAVFDVDVEREEHQIVLERLQMSNMYCERDATIRIELQNIGEEDEEDVELKVISDQLGTVFSDTFDLPSIDDDEEDNIYSETKRLDLDGLSPGSHTLTIRVLYDDGMERIEKELDFRVEECGRKADTGRYEEETGEEMPLDRYSNPNRDLRFLFGPAEQEVVVQMAPQMPKAPQPPRPAALKESAFSIVVLVLANIAIILFIALLLLTLYNKALE
ncbi:MAG: hypothetical protein KKD17_03755 [Nanoarchaeota archaeon]|nr:hypothetical protein [Nanoarchaeota archaeon]